MKKGFSYIELLIVIFIFEIILVIYFTAIGTFALTRHNRYKTAAYHFAAKKMEEIRNTPFNSVSTGTTTESVANLSQGVTTTTISQTATNLKEVEVKVDWQEQTRAKSLRLNTLVTLGGLNPQ